MGRIALYLLGFFLMLAGNLCYGQKQQVSNIKVELEDNILYISYDLLNCNLSDEFEVSIRLSDSEGKEILASSLAGDIGEKISCGTNKRISWDLGADHIVMKSNIGIQVIANLTNISADIPEDRIIKDSTQESDQKEEMTTIEVPEKEDLSETKVTSYNRTAIMLQSLLLPGLGLSRIQGTPHWIRGVVGYGCIAGSIALNSAARRVYFDEIPVYEDFDDKNDLYQKSLTYDNISEVLAYAAIGIWITDIIWTYLGTSDLKTLSYHNDRRRFSFLTSYNSDMYAPLVGFRYTF